MGTIVDAFGRWALAPTMLFLLTGCFKSEHPLLTAAEAVTPLPAKFSAVEIDSDGTIKLPGSRDPSKIPQTLTLTQSDSSYLLSSEGEGKSASIILANLDQNRDTYLAQYTTKGGGKTESQMYYGVVKRTGNVVSAYPFPDLGPSAASFGATSNFLGDIFQDLPHLMAAARKFEDNALATSPVIYRIASTPEEISQLQRDVDAASHRQTVAAVPASPAVSAPLPANAAELTPGSKSCVPADEMDRRTSAAGYVNILQAYAVTPLGESAMKRLRAPDPHDTSHGLAGTFNIDLFHFLHPELISDQKLDFPDMKGASREEKLRLIRKFFAADIRDGTADFMPQKMTFAYSSQLKRVLMITQAMDFDSDYNFIPLPKNCIEHTIEDAKIYDFRAHAFAQPPVLTSSKPSDCSFLLTSWLFGIDCEQLADREKRTAENGGGLFIQGYSDQVGSSMGTVITVNERLIFGDLITVFNNGDSMLKAQLMLAPLPPATVQMLEPSQANH